MKIKKKMFFSNLSKGSKKFSHGTNYEYKYYNFKYIFEFIKSLNVKKDTCQYEFIFKPHYKGPEIKNKFNCLSSY